jgi:hypothetical protein
MKRWTVWDFDHDFATEKLAEIEGHLFARQWIDQKTLIQIMKPDDGQKETGTRN